MAENLLTDTAEAASGALPEAPAKFRNPDTGELRADALLRSYLELERLMSAKAPAPDIPDGPEGYEVSCDHGLFSADPEINKRLHAAGFTRDQAQLLYDLAAERMVPLIQELAAEFQADREVERLTAHFGGEENWRDAARQILAWARQNLPAAAVDGLSTTYDGVLAMYRMMQGAEPGALGRTEGVAASDPQALMKDPRYWRDRDPAFVAQVTEQFRRLYPDEN